MYKLCSYVDTTWDVQTAAILLIHGRCYTLDNEQQQQRISDQQRLIECYESLLNAWQLWHVRAQLTALKIRLNAHKAHVVQPHVGH